MLEATLRNWSALTDTGGVVQADTDLTGDGVREPQNRRVEIVIQ